MSQKEIPPFTICSVYHSAEAKKELEANYELTRRMNPGVSFEWLAADNTQEEVGKLDERKFKVYEGAGEKTWEYKSGWASWRHATALHALLPHIKTRFFLILDPDFYIIRPNWIQVVLAYMEEEGAAFFGSVMHPRYYSKFRYFPSTHCFFGDRSRVALEEMNFMPGENFGEKHPPSRFLRAIAHMPRVLQRILLTITFQDRKFIGDSRDTAYLLFKKFYGNSSIRYQLLTPVYTPWRDLHFPANLFYLPNRFIELFLPDRLCFIPKQKGYFVRQGFREYGAPDIRAIQPHWEEYMWQSKPFGLHLRGTRSKKGYIAHDFQDDFERVKAILEGLDARD